MNDLTRARPPHRLQKHIFVPTFGRFSEYITVGEISACHAERNAKIMPLWEFSLFGGMHCARMEHGSCWVLRLSCTNHSCGQLKGVVPGWVSNVGTNVSTINCSTMDVADDEACSENSAKGDLAPPPHASVAIWSECGLWGVPEAVACFL